MRYLTIMFVLTVLLSSCSKEECTPPPCPDIYNSSCVNNYIFAVGSNWTYQEKTTLQTEICNVSSKNRYTSLGKCGGNPCAASFIYETIEYYYKSPLRGTDVYSITDDHILVENANTHSRANWNCYSQRIDSIIVAGTTYYNVIEQERHDTQTGQTVAKIHIKSGVGIVRREIYNPPIDTSIFELISYQLN